MLTKKELHTFGVHGISAVITPSFNPVLMAMATSFSPLLGSLVMHKCSLRYLWPREEQNCKLV